MKQITRWNYEKIIREQRGELSKLYVFRAVVNDLYDHLIKPPLDSKPDLSWMLSQFKRVWK